MCLSLWAYYIQIKGEFTDRRWAPAPIQSDDSRGGTMWCSHMWHHSMTQACPLEVLHEGHGSLWARELHFEGRRFSTKYFSGVLYYALAADGVQWRSGEKAESVLMSCHLPFEGSHFWMLPLLLFRSPSESLFVTLLTSSLLTLLDDTMSVLYPWLRGLEMDICTWVCLCEFRSSQLVKVKQMCSLRI